MKVSSSNGNARTDFVFLVFATIVLAIWFFFYGHTL